MLEIGSVIDGKYKILYLIGSGGMSNVYLALNEKANKQWAVKEVRKDGGAEDVVRQNLIAETSILRELRHPNLPTIVDVIQENDTYLILMDYIEGITLSKKLSAEGAQKESDVVKWASQICDVLGYLHSRKPPIIYRDTKPSNIMLKPDGNVVLVDFGTARVYKETADEDTSWLGTRGYAAPEQFGGHGQTDERTDIFNLGATMYHLVTGHNPSKPPYEMYPIRKWDKDLSSGLESIILKCTRPNPDERYQSCAELRYALDHYRELEEGYIRKQARQIVLFFTTCALSVLCFVGASVLSKRAGSLTSETYTNHIKNAEVAVTDEQMLEQYEAAISLDPSELQAYSEILDRVYLRDGNFTQAEAEHMLEILGADAGNGTNEAALMKNKPAYDEFAYEMGLAYFYYYEELGNKAMALPWFSVAKDGDIDDWKKLRAERFYKIADYYSLLSNKDKAGDNVVSYSDYWKDLSSLATGNLVENDNERTALVMYREVVYQLIMHANDFRKSGVVKDDLLYVLDNISQHMDTDFDEDRLDEEDIVLLHNLRDSVLSAYESINVSFGGDAADNA